MTTRTGSTLASSIALGAVRPGLRVIAALFLLAGVLAGAWAAPSVGAQTTAVVEIRVHSCPDDLDATGFFQYLTQCTSERGLYGVALGLQAGGLAGPEFQYSQPDDTGRAALMSWPSVNPGTVTVTEVAPDPVRPSVAFCSLQPSSGGPLTKDGEEVPLNDGVMTIELDEGDTLMCDWYRFPGGVTAGDEGGDDGGDDGDDDGDDGGDAGDGDAGDGDGDGGGGAAAGGAVVLDPETGEADEELTGAQIFVRAWDCAADVQRPVVLDVDYAQGLAELTDACAPSEGSYAFSLDDGTEDDEALVDDGEVADEDQDADADDAVDGDDFQGIVAEDGTVVDEEGSGDEAVAGGPSGDGEGDAEDDGGNQGIVAGDEEADEGDGDGRWGREWRRRRCRRRGLRADPGGRRHLPGLERPGRGRIHDPGDRAGGLRPTGALRRDLRGRGGRG